MRHTHTARGARRGSRTGRRERRTELPAGTQQDSSGEQLDGIRRHGGSPRAAVGPAGRRSRTGAVGRGGGGEGGASEPPGNGRNEQPPGRLRASSPKGKREPASISVPAGVNSRPAGRRHLRSVRRQWEGRRAPGGGREPAGSSGTAGARSRMGWTWIGRAAGGRHRGGWGGRQATKRSHAGERRPDTASGAGGDDKPAADRGRGSQWAAAV